MSKTKARKRIIHEPSTHEIFQCLYTMPKYSKILLEQNPDKLYSNFLSWLIDKNFYKGLNEKITIKKISADFRTDTVKATKWIKEIYDQIFELNLDRPELYQSQGAKVCMYMKYFDSICSFYTSLPVIPREFETLRFSFAEAKVGTSRFWVKNVQHEISEDGVESTIWLEGEILNKYREFAIEKALFQDRIYFMDVHKLRSFELDTELKKIYRT